MAPRESEQHPVWQSFCGRDGRLERWEMDPEAEPAAAKGPAPEEEVATLIFCCVAVGVWATLPYTPKGS
jgi:hypothetical protein